MQQRIRVRGIIEDQGEFLLVRNVTSDNFWCLPGGGIEPGEDIISALERELLEETGIVAHIGDLLYVHQFKQADGFHIPEFFFHVTNGSDFRNLDLSKSSHGQQELTDIRFQSLDELNLLPDFLKTELPALARDNFKTAARVRLA